MARPPPPNPCPVCVLVVGAAFFGAVSAVCLVQQRRSGGAGPCAAAIPTVGPELLLTATALLLTLSPSRAASALQCLRTPQVCCTWRDEGAINFYLNWFLARLTTAAKQAKCAERTFFRVM